MAAYGKVPTADVACGLAAHAGPFIDVYRVPAFAHMRTFALIGMRALPVTKGAGHFAHELRVLLARQTLVLRHEA